MSKIYAVGLGPGSMEQMTPKALAAIKNSDVITGYTYYMSLIEPLTEGKEVFATPMRGEVERCKKALEYALAGKNVAMVSSGDCGVYGMAGILFEVCAPYPEVEVEVVAGITACCSGAAVLGAPVGHDFAVISLSDLLTPWDKIEKRLDLAAQADLVICLYNPSSKKRADYLKRACDIMLRHKDGKTPCGVVKNIDREGETSCVMPLCELREYAADMFTTVFIGNSQSKVINGRLVTPRGYKEL